MKPELDEATVPQSMDQGESQIPEASATHVQIAFDTAEAHVLFGRQDPGQRELLPVARVRLSIEHARSLRDALDSFLEEHQAHPGGNLADPDYLTDDREADLPAATVEERAAEHRAFLRTVPRPLVDLLDCEITGLG